MIPLYCTILLVIHLTGLLQYEGEDCGAAAERGQDEDGRGEAATGEREKTLSSSLLLNTALTHQSSVQARAKTATEVAATDLTKWVGASTPARRIVGESEVKGGRAITGSFYKVQLSPFFVYASLSIAPAHGDAFQGKNYINLVDSLNFIYNISNVYFTRTYVCGTYFKYTVHTVKSAYLRIFLICKIETLT